MSNLKLMQITLADDQKLEIQEVFASLANDQQDKVLNMKLLKEALAALGFRLAAYQLRALIEEFRKKQPFMLHDNLTLPELEQLYVHLKSKQVGSSFMSVVSKNENLETLGGSSSISTEGTTHSVRLEEQLAFSDWINTRLIDDVDLKHVLPIDTEGRKLYSAIEDGILLCKIINHSCPDTIDERSINTKGLTVYRKFENLTLALVSALSIGCNIINIDALDLAKGTPHLVLGLLWQIIRIGLFSHITLESCPGLANLLFENEQLAELLKISPEAILLRWVNYHLDRAGITHRCKNFQADIADSEIYVHLLKQISIGSGVNIETNALLESDKLKRAELMLQEAAKLNCRSFVTPPDVVNGVYKLNLAFVANLFNHLPALNVPLENATTENIEETREEKTYKCWMNSMGVTPHVNWLYSDLADGLVIFQLYETIKIGIVNWSRVHRRFTALRKFMQTLENCNYVVELGRQLKFSLVGIAGQDINEGNKTLTLALMWQLMRAYTLSTLTSLSNTGRPIAEKDIVRWVNEKLANADKKSKLKSFHDATLADARTIIDLIDAIKCGSVNYDVVQTAGAAKENLANAKYAISMARKIGARVYALPEDITEIKSKMIMTIFACLMALDSKQQTQPEPQPEPKPQPKPHPQPMPRPRKEMLTVVEKLPAAEPKTQELQLNYAEVQECINETIKELELYDDKMQQLPAIEGEEKSSDAESSVEQQIEESNEFE